MRPLTIDTVLIATDLSDDDVPAVRTAMELSHLAGSHLHVVHASSDPDTDLTQRLHDHLRTADPTSALLPGVTIRAGRADRVIADVARMIDADVIVLGPHRRGRSGSPGGTAYRVAANAERPCLVLPAVLRLPLGRILVPIDASGAARGALAVGLTWASALRRRIAPGSPDATGIIVLHVQPVAEAADGSPAGDGSADELMQSALAAAGERVTAAAGVTVECVCVRAPDAGVAILERAAADELDLIILGTRAHSGTAGQLGSVSAAVTEGAACPLLLVPPRVWRQEQDS
jgi:nucleotide-binding universal stress UspA family protein